MRRDVFYNGEGFGMDVRFVLEDIKDGGEAARAVFSYQGAFIDDAAACGAAVVATWQT